MIEYLYQELFRPIYWTEFWLFRLYGLWALIGKNMKSKSEGLGGSDSTVLIF